MENILNDESRKFILYFLFSVMVVMSVAMFLFYAQLVSLQDSILKNRNVGLSNHDMLYHNSLLLGNITSSLLLLNNPAPVINISKQ